MDEFSLIRRYFSTLTTAHEGVHLGIGDDCALLEVPNGQELAVTTDTLVAGRHFPEHTAAADVGWKALAVNLSDLAAMGAQPRWFTLALTLPQADPLWLAEFASGLNQLAAGQQVALVGGDTTRGPLSITLTAMGLLPCGSALRRSGAQAGDLVCVTGTLGDAALALRQPDLDDALLQRLNRPQPRVEAGLALRGLAHAAIDLSDGLAGDLLHVLEASAVGADLDIDQLPMSAAFERHAPPDQRLALQLAGGDDYELCICLPQTALAEARRRLTVPLAVIGTVSARPGLRYRDGEGRGRVLDLTAYRHFG